jgi:predicted NBD/HSP70 family sugar kinase
MKKISTVQVFGNEIFKEQQLAIGVDLGGRWSFYCVLDEAGKIILEQKLSTTPEAIKADIWKDTAESDRPGDRNTFAMGQSTVNGVGAPSDRGPRTKSGIDHQEQSKR